MRICIYALMLVFLAACGATPMGSADVARDARVAVEAGSGQDAGSETGPDAVPETGADAGFPDVWKPGVDASPPDSEPGVDAAPPDSGSPDSGPPIAPALRISATWAPGGDLDLHLHDHDITQPWFSPHDCYWNNRMPSWGAVFEGPDTGGSVPEVASVAAPALDETYTVAIHAYSYASSSGLAMTEIRCGATSTTLLTHVTAAGGGSGVCSTTTRLYRVATVRITSTGCTVAPLDSSSTGAVACTMY